MRENQRGNRTYADNASSVIKQENNAEPLLQQQEETTGKPSQMNGTNSEGMVYLDIIPRFAL